jgi:membrane-bound inhibitor of C-type lysozyme
MRHYPWLVYSGTTPPELIKENLMRTYLPWLYLVVLTSLSACKPNGSDAPSAELAASSSSVTSSQPTMHPSWDADGDGINDCEKDNSCDDSTDYSQPRPATSAQTLHEKYQAATKLGPFTFHCNDNEQIPLVATFYETQPAAVILERDLEAMELQQVPAASGSKYEAAGTLFWEHQGEARVVWSYNTPELVCKKAE